MRQIPTLIFCLTFLFQISVTSAQIDLKIGQWKSHLPYHTGLSVTQSEDRVYYATEWGVLSMDKLEKSVEYMTTVDGLSAVGAVLIKYITDSKTLIVCYNDSVIDLVREDEIVTITDIPRFTNISGDKQIYDIFPVSEEEVFLATGYGLSLLNLKSGDIRATTFTGVKVNGVDFYNNNIYIATDDGIYFALNDGSVNLDDFGQWTYLGEEAGFPTAYSSNALASFNGSLYLDIDNSLFQMDSAGALDSVHNENDIPITFMSRGKERLMVGFSCKGSCSRILYLESPTNFTLKGSCFKDPLYAIEDQYGVVWYADDSRDNIGYITDPLSGACQKNTFNSPYSHKSNKIVAKNGEVWVASGGIQPNHSYLWYQDGIFAAIDGIWTRYSNNIDELQGLFDFYDIAIHPENGHIYFSSFLGGLVAFDRENFTRYDDSNTTLRNAVGDGDRTRVGGIAFDEEANLWVANHMAAKPIGVLGNDGTWKSFSAPQTRLIDVAVDHSGYKWYITGETGIVVFDEGEMDVDGDERSRVINLSNSALESNKVKSIAVDLEGDVWVGTDQGVYIFECGSDVFNPNCQGVRRIVELGGYNAYLLETEDIRTIAVDGGNRKWFGTTNGVFVQSPNGEEQIATFDTGNSPLFDNTITTIGIDDETGEVYIGTAKGIISYRGEATKGGIVNATAEIYAFPNPVRPDYYGSIAIKGLARDADVKITDVSGRLVYENKALGGQFIWDGNDYNGRRASSGVYLVYIANTQNRDNTDAHVTKILFLN